MELCSLLKCSTQLSLLQLAAFVARQRARHGLACSIGLGARVKTGMGLVCLLCWGGVWPRNGQSPPRAAHVLTVVSHVLTPGGSLSVWQWQLLSPVAPQAFMLTRECIAAVQLFCS
jgi:hypothetical protein